MTHLHHKVSALVDGELKGSARARAIAHARGCEPCRHEIEQTLALKQRLLGLAAAEPSADLFATLASVHADDDPRRSTTSRALGVTRKVLIGAGSMSMVVLTLAYAVGGTDPAEPAAVSPPLDEFTAEFAEANGGSPLADPAVEALSSPERPSAPRLATLISDVRGVTQAQPQQLKPDHLRPWRAADEQAALRQLQRAVVAPTSVAYAGVREVSEVVDGSLKSTRVAIEHVPGQGTSLDVTEATDQELARFITQGKPGVADDLALNRLRLLADAYDLGVVGAGVVAGRAATVVTAGRSGILAARFWIDDATGLLLRREMYDGGQIVRSSTYVSVDTAAKGFLSHLPPELAAPVATSVSKQFAPTLNDEGWTCPDSLPGDFALTVLHRLDPNGDVVHASYSDGLSTVSVFEERGRLDDRSLNDFTTERVGTGDVALREGLPSVAVWQSGDTVYTLVTDAPTSVVTRLVAGLPHQSVEGDDDGRLVRGLKRIGELVNIAD